MATQLVQVNHIVVLNVKSGALVTVVARDRSFDLLLQVQRNLVLGGSYTLKAKVPVADASKQGIDANAEKNEDGYVYLPIALGTFESDFDSTGINMQDLPAFDKSLPVYMLRFSASSNENDVEFSLDDVKHENDAVITLSLNETFRRWRPGMNRTAAINMAVTRLYHDSGSLPKNLNEEQIELAYAKRIQLETTQNAAVGKAMKIVAAPTPTARPSSARPTPQSAAASKAAPSAKSVATPTAKSVTAGARAAAGTISTQKVLPNVTRVATAASRTDTSPNAADGSGKLKVELRELVVQLQRVGEAELARYGIERPAPRSSKSERQIKRRRYDVDDEPDPDALQPGPFKCGYCPVMLATGALLAKHVKVVHKFICSICSKKSPSVAQAREHYRECVLQLNDSLSRKSSARGAVQRVGTSAQRPTSAAQKLGGSAFVGAQKLTAAGQSTVGKLSLTSPTTSSSLLGSKLLSRTTVGSGGSGSAKLASSTPSGTGAHLAKLEAATCIVCKRVCKTVPGLKSHVQQAHRTMYFAVLFAIYRRCAAAQQQSASTLDASASDKQPAFTIEEERFFYDPKNDELRAAISSFFEELEAEKESSALFTLVRELDSDSTRFVALVKTIEDRYAPFGESRRAIWNFLDVERLMRALGRADSQAVSDIMKAQRAASMTLSGVFDDVAVVPEDATTKPKSPVKRPLEESNISISKKLSDDEESTIEFDEEELESAGPEVSRLVKEGPSGFLSRCARLEDGRLKCAECQKEYPNEKAIMKHRVRVHISKLKFRCSFCDHASCDRHALEQHMLTHAKDGQSYECPECAATFDSRAKLTTHLTETSHRPTNDDENVLHKCPFNNCGLIFKTRGFLNGHIERSHAGEPVPPPKPAAEQTGIAIGGVRRSAAQPGSANVSYTGKSLKKFGVKPGSDVSQLIGGPPTNQKTSYKQHPVAPPVTKVKVEEVLYRCSVCEQLFNEKDTVFRHQDELLQAQTRYNALGANANEPHTLANSSTGAPSSVNPLTENDIQYVCGLCDVVFTCECYANQHVRLFHPESDPQAGVDEYADASAYDGTAMQDDTAMLGADTDPASAAMMEEDAAMYAPMDNAVASNEIGME